MSNLQNGIIAVFIVGWFCANAPLGHWSRKWRLEVRGAVFLAGSDPCAGNITAAAAERGSRSQVTLSLWNSCSFYPSLCDRWAESSLKASISTAYPFISLSHSLRPPFSVSLSVTIILHFCLVSFSALLVTRT